jgi:UDP-GlcNAc:undecaprenyl-phosphate GlcNAc-1-phosphate transferase
MLGLISGTASLIFLLGLVDDLWSLNPRVKFAVQALAGVVLYFGGFRVVHMHILFGHRDLGFTVGLGITVFWVLLITNAFNLLDGLDGLAAGAATVATATMFAVHLVNGNAPMAIIVAALAGSILGFLPSNLNPAKIFMGDCGSLFLGFMLSSIALPTSQKSPTLIAVAISLVSFGLPLLDTSLAVMRRFLSGKPLFVADRDHIHHKLLNLGLTQRDAMIALVAVCCAFAFFSVLMLNRAMVGLALAVVFIFVIIGVRRLKYSEFAEVGRLLERAAEQRRVMANNIAIRRACDELTRASDTESIRRILLTAFENNEFDAFEVSYFAPPDSGSYEFACQWERPTTTAVAKGWSIQLDLVGTRWDNRGRFTAYKSLNLPLKVDINCLTSSDFTRSLADALEHAFAEASTKSSELHLQPFELPVSSTVQ